MFILRSVEGEFDSNTRVKSSLEGSNRTKSYIGTTTLLSNGRAKIKGERVAVDVVRLHGWIIVKTSAPVIIGRSTVRRTYYYTIEPNTTTIDEELKNQLLNEIEFLETVEPSTTQEPPVAWLTPDQPIPEPEVLEQRYLDFCNNMKWYWIDGTNCEFLVPQELFDTSKFLDTNIIKTIADSLNNMSLQVNTMQRSDVTFKLCTFKLVNKNGRFTSSEGTENKFGFYGEHVDGRPMLFSIERNITSTIADLTTEVSGVYARLNSKIVDKHSWEQMTPTQRRLFKEKFLEINEVKVISGRAEIEDRFCCDSIKIQADNPFCDNIETTLAAQSEVRINNWDYELDDCKKRKVKMFNNITNKLEDGIVIIDDSDTDYSGALFIQTSGEQKGYINFRGFIFENYPALKKAYGIIEYGSYIPMSQSISGNTSNSRLAVSSIWSHFSKVY